MTSCSHISTITCPICDPHYGTNTLVTPSKCGICGSTAIDHTEAQCIANSKHTKIKIPLEEDL